MARARRDRTVGLVLTALIVVAGILALPDPDVVSTDRRASTTRSSPSGVRALYLALEELEVPVARRMSPLVDAEPLPGAFALVAPTEPASPRELGALLAHVRGGGGLLYVPRREEALLDSLGLELVPWWDVAAVDPEAGVWDVLGGAATGAWDVASREGAWTVAPEDHPWTAGMADVAGFRRAFRTTGEGPEPRPLLADDSLLFAVSLPLGRGRVVALSDPLPLSNEHVRESGVAPLVVRAAAELAAGREPLVFDEYHHGFRGGSVREGVSAFVVRRPAGHGVLQLAGVMVLALLAAGRRFGAPTVAEGPRRSPLEHVDALARAYRESGARRRPRLHLLAGLARHARRRRPQDEDEARTLLGQLRRAAPGAAPALDRLEDALDGRVDDLVAVSTAVDRVTEELRR